MNKQKGFSAVEIVIAVLVIALAGLIGYLVVQAQAPKTSDVNDGTTEATTQTTVVDETDYKITLPQGWAAASEAPNPYTKDLGKSGTVKYYKDANDNYFMVQIDAPGRGFEANETWALSSANSSFSVASQTTCTPGEAFCTHVDAGEYRVGMKTDGQTNGHHYFFFAGNSANETGVGTDVFKQIVQSIVLK